MYVILDSNIYCQDYFGKSASFRFLVHYLNNNGYTLLLPRVVIEEVANVRARKVAEELDALRKSLDALEKMSTLSLPAVPSALTTEPYDLLALMSTNIYDIEVIEYDSLEHSAVFERALRVQRPFRANEKGYRDTLLWLSFLEFLKANPKGTEVIFINSNKSDFFSDKTDIEFHPDLHKDLALLPDVKVKPYLSVAAFVEKEVDKDEHLIDHTKALPLFEDYLEEEGLVFLSSVESRFLHTLDKVAIPGGEVLVHATSVSAEFVEAIEDMHVDVTNHFGGDNIYVACTHDFRIVDFEVTIPETVYAANKAAIASSSHVYDAAYDAKSAVVHVVARAYTPFRPKLASNHSFHLLTFKSIPLLRKIDASYWNTAKLEICRNSRRFFEMPQLHQRTPILSQHIAPRPQEKGGVARQTAQLANLPAAESP